MLLEEPRASEDDLAGVCPLEHQVRFGLFARGCPERNDVVAASASGARARASVRELPRHSSFIIIIVKRVIVFA